MRGGTVSAVMAASALLAVAAEAAAQPARTNAGPVTPVQQLAVLTLASTGCLLTEASRRYGPSADVDAVAAAVQRACDPQAVALYRFRAAHPELARGDESSLDSTRLAARQVAGLVLSQISRASTPQAHSASPPPAAGSDAPAPMSLQGPNDGRFGHFASPEEREAQLRQARAYCARSGRHATMTLDNEVGRWFAFHCFREVTGRQLAAGDNGY